MQQSNYCIDEHAPEINYICARAYVLFVAIVIIAAKNSLSPSGTLGKHKKCVVWRSEELNVATTTTAAKKKLPSESCRNKNGIIMYAPCSYRRVCACPSYRAHRIGVIRYST